MEKPNLNEADAKSEKSTQIPKPKRIKRECGCKKKRQQK
jgi:hypothetical protein